MLSKPIQATERIGAQPAIQAGLLAEVSRLQPSEACAKLGSAPEGLSETEAAERLEKFGPNLVARERKATIPEEIWSRARNPLNALLLTLAIVSYFLGDVRAAVVIAAMVVLAIMTAFVQEHRSNQAAARLRAMVHTTASVRRNPSPPDGPFAEIPDGSSRAGRRGAAFGRRHDPRRSAPARSQGSLHQSVGADRRVHARRKARIGKHIELR